MKLTIEPTPEIVQLRTGGVNVPARVWTGVDEHGIEVRAFITLVSPQTHDVDTNARFARELKEVAARRDPGAIDLRYFLD